MHAHHKKFIEYNIHEVKSDLVVSSLSEEERATRISTKALPSLPIMRGDTNLPLEGQEKQLTNRYLCCRFVREPVTKGKRWFIT